MTVTLEKRRYGTMVSWLRCRCWDNRVKPTEKPPGTDGEWSAGMIHTTWDESPRSTLCIGVLQKKNLLVRFFRGMTTNRIARDNAGTRRRIPSLLGGLRGIAGSFPILTKGAAFSSFGERAVLFDFS